MLMMDTMQLVSPLPQRKIVPVKWNVMILLIPYNGGANFAGMTLLSAANSAYALGL